MEKIVIPTTVGTGTGYALFSNKSEPLRAKVMVSHAWDEYYRDFALALRKAGSSEEGHSGPFWICAFAIYQPEDIPGLTIAKQLGPDPSRGPFASVLKSAEAMLCIVTTSCDIYTRQGGSGTALKSQAKIVKRQPIEVCKRKLRKKKKKNTHTHTHRNAICLAGWFL